MNVSSVGSSWLTQLGSALFSKLDTQGKGYIDQSDLSAAIDKSQSTTATTTTADTSSTATLFQSLDSDGDGKVTKTELTKGLQTLADALFQNLRGASDSSSSAPPPPPGGAGGPPPGGEPPSFTKDQLTEMAQSSSTDPTQAKLFQTLADNFSAADTDGDGKISASEAHAYQQSTSSSSTGSTTASTAGSTTTDAASVASALQKLALLLSAYGVGSTSTTASSASSTSGTLLASA